MEPRPTTGGFTELQPARWPSTLYGVDKDQGGGGDIVGDGNPGRTGAGGGGVQGGVRNIEAVSGGGAQMFEEHDDGNGVRRFASRPGIEGTADGGTAMNRNFAWQLSF